jgi:hypothetical protein
MLAMEATVIKEARMSTIGSRWMRGALFACASLCAACDEADDCYNTLTCPEAPVPDAGVIFVFVTPDAGPPCNGTCTTINLSDWQLPTLVWLGTDETSAPSARNKRPERGTTPHRPTHRPARRASALCRLGVAARCPRT